MKCVLQGIAVILCALLLVLFGMAMGQENVIILSLIVGCAGILCTFWKSLKNVWNLIKEELRNNA